jgi:hypothetical protein
VVDALHVLSDQGDCLAGRFDSGRSYRRHKRFWVHVSSDGIGINKPDLSDKAGFERFHLAGACSTGADLC